MVLNCRGETWPSNIIVYASSVTSPFCQEGQRERTFLIFLFFPDFSLFFPDLFPLFPNFWQKFRCQGGHSAPLAPPSGWLCILLPLFEILTLISYTVNIVNHNCRRVYLECDILFHIILWIFKFNSKVKYSTMHITQHGMICSALLNSLEDNVVFSQNLLFLPEVLTLMYNVNVKPRLGLYIFYGFSNCI